MNLRRTSILTLIAVPVLAIGLAACGGSSNSDNGSSNAASTAAVASTSSTSDTVATKSVSGVGSVLVDSKGDVLYTNDQDSGSKIACMGSCQSIWVPLAAPSSGQPTSADSSVQAKLDVEGGQVTFGGKPLYTFVQDSPGEATGNGVTDSFDGTTFTWTAAMSAGATSGSSSTSTGTSGASGGAPSGGYGGGY
jgi:predicted lipoprotein with Yx(FWY)xxD motif